MKIISSILMFKMNLSFFANVSKQFLFTFLSNGHHQRLLRDRFLLHILEIPTVREHA